VLMVVNTKGVCGRFVSVCSVTECKNYGTV
jgi:hypothetical protein